MMLAAELRQIGRDRPRFGLIKVPDDQRRARFRKTQRYRAAKPCAAARDNGGAAGERYQFGQALPGKIRIGHNNSP